MMFKNAKVWKRLPIQDIVFYNYNANRMQIRFKYKIDTAYIFRINQVLNINPVTT
jgi:hypothetical protein